LILTSCPHCGCQGSVQDSLAGTTLVCPKCGGQFVVGGQAPRTRRNFDEEDELPRRPIAKPDQSKTVGLALGIGLAAVGLILVAGCFFTCCIWPVFLNSPKSGQADSAAQAAPVIAASTTADGMMDEYRANEVAADTRFLDKWVRVSGTVERVASGISEPYVVFKPGKKFSIDHVRCYFPDAQAVVNLRPGQSVTIVGKCRGRSSLILRQMMRCCTDSF
jgi:hypothetical protein